MQVSQLVIYPIKSLGGISLKEAQLSDRGLALDRRFMLIDEQGIFLTQRTLPEMALLRPSFENEVLRIKHTSGGLAPLDVPLPGSSDFKTGQALQVDVWSDSMMAVALSSSYDKWFSEALGRSVRLVYMPEESHRFVKEPYARNKDLNSFSDGMPILIIGEESLHALNRLLDQPVPMDRFRPNIVFSGGLAYLEDNFREIKIGNRRFWGGKRCARCNMTTINQDTAAVGMEPLKTLSTYRRFGNKVMVWHEFAFGRGGQHSCR